MKIDFDRNRLMIGEKTIEMEATIREADRYKNLIFVRFAYDEYQAGDLNAERNIVAVDLDGNVRWRIEMAPEVQVVDGKRMDNSYAGIDPDTGKKERPVEAYDTTGSCWNVDPETGKVSDPIFSR